MSLEGIDVDKEIDNLRSLFLPFAKKVISLGKDDKSLVSNSLVLKNEDISLYLSKIDGTATPVAISFFMIDKVYFWFSDGTVGYFKNLEALKVNGEIVINHNTKFSDNFTYISDFHLYNDDSVQNNEILMEHRPEAVEAVERNKKTFVVVSQFLKLRFKMFG